MTPNGQSSGGWFGGAFDDDDIVWLLLVAAVMSPALLATIPSWRDAGARWLVAHHILADASTNPVWTIPGDIAGLDWRRLLLVAVVVGVAATVATVNWLARRARAEQQRLLTGDTD